MDQTARQRRQQQQPRSRVMSARDSGNKVKGFAAPISGRDRETVAHTLARQRNFRSPKFTLQAISQSQQHPLLSGWTPPIDVILIHIKICHIWNEIRQRTESASTDPYFEKWQSIMVNALSESEFCGLINDRRRLSLDHFW